MAELECSKPCPQEVGTEFAGSPGPVRDDEIICRAAKALHFNKSGIKQAVIQRAYLRDGELSVWRIETGAQAAALEALATKLDPGPGDPKLEIRQILGVEASALRAISLNGGGRAVSVIDDTRTDDAGGYDPQHAALAPCLRLRDAVREPDSTMLTVLVERLFMIFRAGKLWEAPAQPDTSPAG